MTGPMGANVLAEQAFRDLMAAVCAPVTIADLIAAC
jgi:hypothetical protein